MSCEFTDEQLEGFRKIADRSNGPPPRIYYDAKGNKLRESLPASVYLLWGRGTKKFHLPMPNPGEEAFDWSVIYNFPKQPPKPCDGVDGLTQSLAGLTLNQPVAVRRQLPAATYAAAVRGQTPAATQQRKTYAAAVRTPMPR